MKTLNLWYSLVIFNIVLAIVFTILVGFYNLSDTEIIKPIHNVTSQIAQERTSEEIQNSIDKAYTDYTELYIPFDLIMLGLIINTYAGLIYSSIKNQKESVFSFFGLLTFGSILFLFIIGISTQVQDWVIVELYLNVFEESSVATPLMDYFFSNVGLISFFMGVILLVINQIDQLKTKLLRLGE